MGATMSTKSSLGLGTFETKKTYLIHIYLEITNDKYYMEDSSDNKIELPNKEVAEKLAKVIEELGMNGEED